MGTQVISQLVGKVIILCLINTATGTTNALFFFYLPHAALPSCNAIVTVGGFNVLSSIYLSKCLFY